MSNQWQAVSEQTQLWRWEANCVLEAYTHTCSCQYAAADSY